MRVHCVIHASFEAPGAIETWAIQKDHALSYTHIYAGEKLPTDLHDFDFLIFMGGPQSPLELDQYPYIADEIKLAKQAIEANKAVFGVCLGAQIIAEALGAKTERSPHKEIGSYPVSVLPAGQGDPCFSQFPSSFNVIHWHNDMPGLPQDAVLLAKSEGCPRQAFCYGDRVYGFQFHLEPTLALIEGMIAHCPNDLTVGKYVHTADELRAINYKQINEYLFVFLDHIEALVASKIPA